MSAAAAGLPCCCHSWSCYQVAQMLGPQLFLSFLFCGEYYCASHRITAMSVSRQETFCNNLGRLLEGGGIWHILRAREIWIGFSCCSSFISRIQIRRGSECSCQLHLQCFPESIFPTSFWRLTLLLEMILLHTIPRIREFIWILNSMLRAPLGHGELPPFFAFWSFVCLGTEKFFKSCQGLEIPQTSDHIALFHFLNVTYHNNS